MKYYKIVYLTLFLNCFFFMQQNNALFSILLADLMALNEINALNRKALWNGIKELFNQSNIDIKIFNKSPNTLSNEKNDPMRSFSFADLAGNIPLDIREIAEFIKNRDKFSRLGAQAPRGVILYGPPGTGKTSIARAIAGEVDADFFDACASSFIETYVGVGPKRVRDLFDKARESNKHAIIFIDEIDAIGGKRHGESNSEYRNTLNELLNQMDGFTQNNITVLAATNDPKMLDEALLRPGRFDRKVKIDLPDEESRTAIIAHYCSKITYKGPESIFNEIALKTAGWSGADIKGMLNEAAIFAARENSDEVEVRHLWMGFNKTIKQKNIV